MSRIRENGAYFFYKQVFISLLPKVLKKEIGWRVQYQYAVSTFYQLPDHIRQVFEKLKDLEKEKMKEEGGVRLTVGEKDVYVTDEIRSFIESVIEKG